MYRGLRLALVALLATAPPLAGQTRGLTPKDLFALRSVADVQVSPDGSRVAYSVMHNDAPGRPYAVVTILNLETGRSSTLPRGSSGPRWAPDGRRLAFMGQSAEGAGLMVSEADGSGARFLAPVEGTNHPLPSAGESVSWAPDGRRIAYVSATPGPESADANGDPMVITRYLYKPTAGEGSTRFNDNRRTHVFVVDVGTRQVSQLTEGAAYEHSIDWAPKGDEIVFVSNREANPDRTFNYDVFTVSARTRELRRVTASKSAEYSPVWSPDGTRLAFAGTRRDLTSSETTMEDTHVWVMNADGSGRRGARRRGGQPPGRAAVVRRRPARVLRAAGARRGAAGAAARHRRTARAGGQGPRQRRGVGPGPLGGRLRADHARRTGGPLHRRPRRVGNPRAADHAERHAPRRSRDRRGGGLPLSERRRHRGRSVPHQAARRRRRGRGIRSS